MACPLSEELAEALRWVRKLSSSEIRAEKKKLNTAVGDEGGFAPT